MEYCKKNSNLAIYIPQGDSFQYDELYSYLKRNSHIELVIIIDECPKWKIDGMWGQFANNLPNIKIISIYNEMESTCIDANTKIMELKKISDEGFARILNQDYGVDNSLANHYARLCDGYPRLAHLIGKNPDFKISSMELLDDIFKKIIIDSDVADKKKTESVINILQFLSIFKKFGWYDEIKDEQEYIKNLISHYDKDIEIKDINNVINKLKRKKLIQGEFTCYISPQILHIWLFKNFLNDTCKINTLKKNLKYMPVNLLTWHGEMLKYTEDTTAGQNYTNELILNYDYNKLKMELESNNNFFFNLTKANTLRALQQLLCIFEKLSDEQILDLKNRMNLIWSLEFILMDKDRYFKPAIGILYRLALNESDLVYSNNATGIFCQMFQFALSGNKANLKIRAQFLNDTYKNAKSEKEFLLILKAFNSALRLSHFSRMASSEEQDFEANKDYMPETYAEIYDYWTTIMDMLIDMISKIESSSILKSILETASSIIFTIWTKHNDMQSKIKELYEAIKASAFIDNKVLLSSINKTLRFSNYSKKSREYSLDYFINLREELISYDENEGLDYYLENDIWDIVEKQDDYSKINETYINLLEEKVIKIFNEKSTSEKINILRYFIEKNPQNIYYFGLVVSILDAEYKLFSLIVDLFKDKNQNTQFIAGYLLNVHNLDLEKYNSYAKLFYKNEEFNHIIPVMASKAFLTNTVSDYLLDLMKRNKLSTNEITSLKHIGENIKLENIKKILKYCNGLKKQESIDTALHIIYFNYTKINSLENEIYKSLFNVFNGENILITREPYIWCSVLANYIDESVDKKNILFLFKQIIDYWSTYKKVAHVYDGDDIKKIMTKIVKKYPQECWHITNKYIDFMPTLLNPINAWLRGNYSFETTPGALTEFNLEDIIQWINEDVDNNLKIVANCSPKDLFSEDSKIMRTLLVNYGNNYDLHHFIVLNFGNRGFVGSASQILKDEIELVNKFKATEKNDNVLFFIDEYLDILQNDAKRHLMFEERHF